MVEKNRKTKGIANESDAIIGKNLKNIRILKDMSQEMLASKVGITFQQIQKYEKGVNRIAASRLLELASILNVDLKIFYKGLLEQDDEINDLHLLDIDPKVLALAQKLQEIDDPSVLKSLKTLLKAFK
ncbi:MAG: helix-turn-helix domain-containing protein [Alphaproteobacteria bacterium]